MVTGENLDNTESAFKILYSAPHWFPKLPYIVIILQYHYAFFENTIPKGFI